MPGGLPPINPRDIKPPSAIAKKVGERQDGSPIYQAGPDAKKGYNQGEIVPNDYAEKARQSRRQWNLTRQLMRNMDMDQSEAWDQSRKVKQELENASDEKERREVWKQYAY